MLISEALPLLVSMLDDAGVNRSMVNAIDVLTIVKVFQRFAALPLDGAASPEVDGDGVLAQFGTFDSRGKRWFSTDLTRQFVEAGDEDMPMWQLSCTIYWDPNAETEALASGHSWSFGKTLGEFFAEAVALPGWIWALAGGKEPRDLVIVLDEI